MDIGVRWAVVTFVASSITECQWNLKTVVGLLYCSFFLTYLYVRRAIIIQESQNMLIQQNDFKSEPNPLFSMHF